MGEAILDESIAPVDLQVGRMDWLDDANCRGTDPNFFHPERGDNFGVRAAKAICSTCIVKVECLDYALETRQKQGVWGQKSAKQRSHMLNGTAL